MPNPFASVSCPEPEFGFALNVFSLAGGPLGLPGAASARSTEVGAGTGADAVAKGKVEGGGEGVFDDQFAFTGRLVYVAELRGVQ